MDKILVKGRYDLRITHAAWQDGPRIRGQKVIQVNLWHEDTQQNLQAADFITKLDKFTQEEVEAKGLEILRGHLCVGCYVKEFREGPFIKNEVILPEITLSHKIQKEDNVFLLEDFAA